MLYQRFPLLCAIFTTITSADINRGYGRNVRAIIAAGDGRSCSYGGERFGEGSAVPTREACLHCVCARGALQCRQRACAPLPDPPPRRCHTVHRKNSCCPELHCPDGISTMEHGGSGRLEHDDYTPISTNAAIHGCAEGGTVYAAGSALGSRLACEQCFCLGGVRRCVRPRCLPPPTGCRARQAPGACCPTRYYCDHTKTSVSTRPPGQTNHDCFLDGRWTSEGDRVLLPKEESCTQCFCLRGAVQCQPLACAPSLMGCRPLLRSGQCCPHQYDCPHQRHHGVLETMNTAVTHNLLYISDNSLTYSKNEDRALHTSKSYKNEASSIIPSDVNKITTRSNLQESDAIQKESSTTTKVKRKTNESSTVVTSRKPYESKATSSPAPGLFATKPSKVILKYTTTDNEDTTIDEIRTTENILTENTTQQPEGTVKIMINGTINCTAELSSTSEPLNVTINGTNLSDGFSDIQARIPIVNIDRIDFEDQTFDPNDIITDRSVNGGFDENDMFTINVTSSLIANKSLSTPIPGSVISIAGPIHNVSKTVKDVYDYDYNDATLPPSLPNLKIIPFVAADAVVEDAATSKEPVPFAAIERDDKYPVYYPNTEKRQTLFANRREDVYNPTQYPIFVSEKVTQSQLPILSHSLGLPSNTDFAKKNDDLSSSAHVYTISTSVDSHLLDLSINGDHVTKPPLPSTKFKIETPSINLFSPPVETEGGFIPKGPGIVGEYFAVYPSTPVTPIALLTTSMQLDAQKGECTSSDNRRVPEGESISLACSVCTCAWGEMHCSPRVCLTPPGCRRRPAKHNAEDLCCGELICLRANQTTSTSLPFTTTTEVNRNMIKEITNKYNIPNNIATATPNNTLVDVTTKKEYEVHIYNLNTKQFNKTAEDLDKNTPTKSNATAIHTTEASIHNMSLNSTTSLSAMILETHNETDEKVSSSQEYEDEEEEDEGFSFGSVLKLLLSDSYDTTTSSPPKRKTTLVERTVTPITNPTFTTTTTTTTIKPSTTTVRTPTKPTVPPFVALPNIYPPSRKIPSNNVNKIDHLVLGELTSIKKTTAKPMSTSSRPLIIATRKPFTTTLRPPEKQISDDNFIGNHYNSVVEGLRKPTPTSSGLGAGLLKLAGCNIYGKMYKVGKVISELSTPCLECRCTEIGVQCRALNC